MTKLSRVYPIFLLPSTSHGKLLACTQTKQKQVTSEIIITCEFYKNIWFAFACVFIPIDEFLKLPFFKPPECLHGPCTLTSAKHFFLLKRNNLCLLSLHTFPICLENHMLSLFSCQRFSFSIHLLRKKNCKHTSFSQVFSPIALHFESLYIHRSVPMETRKKFPYSTLRK